MLNVSIAEIQHKIEAGELTYETLTLYYLKRVEAYNEEVNAISEVNPNALEQARILDEEYRQTGRRTMLHGIPVMIKDNINIGSDGFHTTAGAYVFSTMQSTYDATIVKRLKKAGAIILGKTNLTEFANFISDESPNGFSALKGQVKNPYGKFDVGGSSSGSAVAVACGFCQVAIGTETSGSIISPASCNSIIGLKPSIGVVSRVGIIPISSSQDVPGPMGRNVQDVAIVQKIIEGFDPEDGSTKVLLQEGERDLSLTQPFDLKSLHLGVYEGEGPLRKAADVVFDDAIAKLKALGMMTEVVTYNADDYTINWDVLYYEFPRDLRNYLKSMNAVTEVKTLEDIVSFNKSDLLKYVPYDQKIFEKSLSISGDFDQQYEKALRDSYSYGRIINGWLNDCRLDVVCYVHCDAIDIAARMGHPSITMPIGYTDEGEPVGFTITGPMYSEKLLLTLVKKLTPIIGEQKQVRFEL